MRKSMKFQNTNNLKLQEILRHPQFFRISILSIHKDVYQIALDSINISTIMLQITFSIFQNNRSISLTDEA